MDLRTFLAELEARGELQRVTEPVAPTFEVARRIAAQEGQPLLFEALPGFPEWRLVSGCLARREHLALALGCEVPELVLYKKR